MVASSSSFGPAIITLLLLFFVRGNLYNYRETVLVAIVTAVVSVDAIYAINNVNTDADADANAAATDYTAFS